MFRRFIVFWLVFFLFSATAGAAEPLRVVASFSILGDMAHTIGGDDVSVSVLVGPDEDAHTYEPSPSDIRKLAKADVIIINGLRFEGWMNRLIDASQTKAKLLVASAGLRPRLMADEEDGEPVIDPHAWQSLTNGRLYVRNIASGLMSLRPDLTPAIRQRALAYLGELSKLDREIKNKIALIPHDKRLIITTHDAFGYFGEAYSVPFLAPLGLSTEAEPSAEDFSKLINQIKEKHVHTLFLENMASPRLIQQLEKETGAKIGGRLYSDALSEPDGEAPTYLEMMRHNAHLLIGAMKENPS